ncbi:MAG: response regulator [Pseudomonadota bacterium]
MMSAISRMLIVDDDSDDQFLYARLIKRSGFVVSLQQFTDAREAVGFIRAEPQQSIDVILLDINMPAMNGFAFLEEISTIYSDEAAPFVVCMLTSSLNPSDREKASSYAMVRHYCPKPLTMEKLDEIVQIVAS